MRKYENLDEASAGRREATSQSRRLRILRRLAHSIRHVEDTDHVFNAALDSALALVDADIGALSYANRSTQRYILAASRGLSDAYLREIKTWSLHEGLAGQVYGLREPLTIVDLRASRDVPRDIVHTEHLRGYVCVPLLRGQSRLGIIEVFDSEPRSFAVEEVESLELVAAFVSSVVESSVMSDELQFLREERSQVLRQWSTQALTAAENQRQETVRAVLAEADWLEADDTQHCGAAARLRALAETLGDADLEWVDMVPLVRQSIVDRWNDHSHKQVRFDLGLWPELLPLELTTRLYLLMQAMVTLAVQAADSSVTLYLGGEGDVMWVQVCDDRPRTPGGDPVKEIPAGLLSNVRGMSGTVQAVTGEGGHAGVRVVLPQSLSRPEVLALTPRERHVLEALTIGTPNRAIAAELEISPKTLQNHLTAIYRKLGVTSRAEAVRFL